MRAVISFARRNKDAVAQQIRVYASQIAVATESNVFTRQADGVPREASWTPTLSQFQKTKVTTLPNGLRVATEYMPFVDTACVGMYIDAGSRYETDANNGSAHFLEHLIFKGTPKRSVYNIEVDVENIGANLNAYTSREQTAYVARCIGSDMPVIIDMLGDILQNSKLSSDAVTRERDVILREAKEIDGMPEEVCFDHLHATAFQHTPLGRTILGPTENIKKITRDDVEAYIQTHYTAGRMVLAAAGNVSHDDVVKLAEKTFSGLPADSTSAGDLIKADPSHFTGSMVAVRDPDMPTTSLAVAFQGTSWVDADSIPLMVMQTLLGAWNKNAYTAHHQRSRLALLVSANELADSYMAFNTSYHDTGIFGIYASTSSPEKLEDLSFAIMQEMTRLAYEVDEDDLLQAKNSLKTSILAASVLANGVCEELGRQLLVYGRRIPREELFARIDAVDVSTINAVASRVIQDQDPAISAVGELSFLPDYTWFRRRTYWNRY